METKTSSILKSVSALLEYFASDGDLMGLYPIIGKGIESWPVISVPHSGDPAEIIASSPASHVPFSW